VCQWEKERRSMTKAVQALIVEASLMRMTERMEEDIRADHHCRICCKTTVKLRVKLIKWNEDHELKSIISYY
jgi:hypothetical protein